VRNVSRVTGLFDGGWGFENQQWKRKTSSPNNADRHRKSHIILANVYEGVIGRSINLNAQLHILASIIKSGFVLPPPLLSSQPYSN